MKSEGAFFFFCIPAIGEGGGGGYIVKIEATCILQNVRLLA
jgi:hypothetical protein